MRIVDVNEFYSPTGGGVRTYIDRKMAIMAELGHQLSVIAPGRDDRTETRPGGSIHFVRSPNMPFDRNYGLFWDAQPIHDLLDRLNPDVVECSSPWRPAWIVAGWPGHAPKSFFMHNDNVAAYPQRWLGKVASPARVDRGFAWYSRYMNSFLGRYDTVLTNGPALYKRLTARGVRVDVSMPLGIEKDRFSPLLRDESLRSELLAACELSDDAVLLLGIGRHHPEKRWPFIIDAVERASASHPIALVLLGTGSDGHRIDRRISGSPHIRMFNPIYDRERLARILASCDALIHGAEAEPFGLVALEAQASGLPLIVPDEGGCAELAQSGCSEIYVARDAASCAAAILRMAAHDRRQIRTAAAQAATTVRSDQDHVTDLLDHYRALISRRERLTA